jgi:polyvinyl alcohol dehydrogenase (cytochrome)
MPRFLLSLSSPRRRTLAVGCGVCAALALAAALALPLAASGPEGGFGWQMIGRDIRNTRHQPFEREIHRANVWRLRPKWEFTTAGDVSATPAIARGAHDRGGLAVYFPDWGGKLWKVDAGSGEVVWSRDIADYNGIAGSISRTSPVYAAGVIYVADLNGNMMAVDADTGDLRWITELDPNPNTIVTTSPIIHANRLYISTSSSGGGAARMIFRGSMIALDARTGRIIWQSFVLPDNGGVAGGFAGGAFVNPPAIDVNNGLVYGAAGQLYFQPDSVTACLAAAPNHWDEACFPRDAYFNSVIAFDLRTGKPRWSFRGAGPDARRLACGDNPPSWCPPWENNFNVWDFAGAGANVFEARIHGRRREVVGIGQKSGVYWLFDARTGKLLWGSLVGHADDPGGIQWGTAVDGRRIYVAIGHNNRRDPYDLPSGETVTGGSWAALNPADGRILWQTPDPQWTVDPRGASDLAALSVANGIVFAGSMAHAGEQMYALNSATGAILWRFPAGGSVVAGPAIVRGTVYWGSGYARTGGVGNDKFYAFSIDGR